MEQSLDTIMDDLTEAQREAASHMDGPALVLAGPGSGKTRVITRRIAHLIANGVPAWSILALTFTNKAAGEMRNRVDAIVPANIPGRRGLTVTTFHSLGARLLRRYAAQAGMPENYLIYDTADQRAAIKQAIKDAGLDSKNWTPGSVHGHISHAKNQLIDAPTFAAQAGDFFARTVAKIYTAYEAILAKAGAVDFDDLLLRLARLLRDDESVRADLQDRYQYLLIDEYQDTNHVQFVIAHALAARGRNIFVVGDPDQSIYGWRGADIRNIIDFDTHYPDARVIPLGQNFRSTGHIVSIADHLIRHNRQRKHKTLFTEHEDGERARVVRCGDEHHEAALVVDELRRGRDEGLAWKDMAVFYRVNALSRVMEEALRRESIPYVIARGTAFYERQEIKDAIAYLRVLANPRDEVSLRRIINTPARGIGATSIEKLELHAIRRGLALIDACRAAHQIDGLSAKAAKAIAQFAEMIDRWRARAGAVDHTAVSHPPPSPLPQREGEHSELLPRDEESDSLLPADSAADLRDIVEMVLRESGLEALYRQAKSEEDQDRLENLEELVSSAAQFVPPLDAGEDPSPFRTLFAWLESIALVSDADMVDPANGAVTLMTLHAAKGLEFPLVCMIGLEHGILPHANAGDTDAGLEEERRLCFVGITRAERRLLISSAAVRTHRGVRERTIPSMFLRELPAAHVESLDAHDPSSLHDDGDEPGATGLRFVRDADADRPFIEFAVGTRVRHPQFGRGTIRSLERTRDSTRAKVSFDAVGVKTLILEFARLEVEE
jgi:DNA helicase-2/ATP-dependent DNA helicase PcrA